jgi:hypothetical protein
MRNVTFVLAAAFLAVATLSACGESPEDLTAQAEYQARQELERAQREAYHLVIERLDESDERRFHQALYRISRARQYELGDYATDDEIDEAYEEQNRVRAARELNLPVSASWDQIWEMRREQQSVEFHRGRAERLGVPVATSSDELDRLEQERQRVEAARRHNLPDTATWDDISTASNEADRRRTARRYDLPETATWNEIRRAIRANRSSSSGREAIEHLNALTSARAELNRLEREVDVADRRVRAIERNLPADASEEDIEEYELNRLRMRVAIVLNLDEGAGWGNIYDAVGYADRY